MAERIQTPTLPVPRQARSAQTRRRLLGAAVSCLAERGMAATTTTEVCRRAGVSQGALFKHFPSKALLLGATVEHLYAELVRDFRRGFGEIATHSEAGDGIHHAVRILWRIFRQPRLQASFELHVAARTDSDVRDALTPVLARHRENLQREARALFPAASRRRPRFAAAVGVILDAMQGAALGGIALADPAAERAQLAFLEHLARQELGELSA